MRLLLDEHLSPKPVRRLGDLFPESVHVQGLGLRGGKDRALWDLARREGLVIVTRDSDFEHLAMTLGAPPKAIIVRSQDGHTEVIESLLRQHSADILRFGVSPEASFLIVE